MDGEQPKIQIAGLTDVGRARDHNEDYVGWDETAGLAVLADGMGGHNAGEVASELAVRTIIDALSAGTSEQKVDYPEAVKAAVEQANETIRKGAAGRPHCSGMGTTVAVVSLNGNRLTIAHVGDSRVYRLGPEGLEQLTTDHSVVQELVDSGFLSAEEAEASVNRNVITRALGTEERVEVEVNTRSAEPGDLFLLCSDGLSDLVKADTIHRLCTDTTDLGEAAGALVDAANGAGGTDNISVILFRLVEPWQN